MNRRVAFRGREVVKRLRDGADAGTLISRTDGLIANGVPTPRARSGDAPDAIVFDRIAGESGLAVLATQGSAALADLIAPLADLHRASLPGLPLFDPLLRIRPRLGASMPDWVNSWIRRNAPPPGQCGTVHGDFHAGQLIRDPAGKVWILDLDDLALGPAEADLGNFAAHLATRPETADGPPLAAFPRWADAVLGARPHSDPALIHAYGRIALLRRALKLAEQGEPGVLEALRAA